MYSFLVGGFVPGTNVQLSFQTYLAIMSLLVGSISIVWIEKRRHYLAAATIQLRQPLHASQLHQRVR